MRAAAGDVRILPDVEGSRIRPFNDADEHALKSDAGRPAPSSTS